MPNDNSPDPTLEALDEIRAAVNGLASVISQGFPLDKRETFAALVMMGLASRLQPLHTDSVAHQTKVVKLSFALADSALRECTPKEE
jgi:hypothetical protein